MPSAEELREYDHAQFKREFIDPIGPDRSHCLIVGNTGSGKTTMMFYLLDILNTAYPTLTYFWFDLPKSSESLTLSLFKPCQYIIPYGVDLKITLKNTTTKEPYPV